MSCDYKDSSVLAEEAGQLQYTLRTGFRIYYDPQRCLPPDLVSEVVGHEAANVIDSIRLLAGDANKLVSVLELGVGSGISLLGLLENVGIKDNLILEGIDIEPYCVGLSRTNVERLAVSHNIRPNLCMYQADWSDDQTWTTLRAKRYHVIIFNPPYLPRGEDVREGYEQVPAWMVYTNDALGMEHYQKILPLLPPILSDDLGSAILVRRAGMTLDVEKERVFRTLATDVMRQIPGSCSTDLMMPISSDRTGHWMCISRSDSVLPSHKNPLVVYALAHGLNRVPTLQELVS